MKLSYAGFRGELPILDPRLLPDQNAQVARNVYLRHGTLKPEQAPGAVQGLPNIISPSSLYRYPNGNSGTGFWLVWDDSKQVHAVKSPLANDAWKRIYWTGDGVPRMGGIDLVTSGTGPYPAASYRLGLPAPNQSPTVAPVAGRVPPDEYPSTALDTVYVVTLISRYGEEGPPSAPSPVITRWDMVEGAPAGGGVEVSLPGIPSGNHDIATLRLYRVESGGVYQFVADIAPGTASYTDTILSEQLGLALPSLSWDMPDDRMVGLTALPNGILAGFFENTLCFSEAYYPHAWPVGYRLAFPEDIVAIAATSAGLIVATEGQPHLVTGSSPAAMSDMHLDEDQPCISARSLVDMGEYGLYAAPTGLVAVGGGEARVITAGMISRDQWQELKPGTIHAYRYDSRYLAFCEGGCFMFTPGEGFEFFDIAADGGYFDIADGTLYLIQGETITAWGQGPTMTLRWRSKIHEIPPGSAGFSCAKITARDYPVTLRLFADGATVIEHAVEDGQLFRLPDGFTLSRDWEVEVEGQYEIQSIQIATTPTEVV